MIVVGNRMYSGSVVDLIRVKNAWIEKKNLRWVMVLGREADVIEKCLYYIKGIENENRDTLFVEPDKAKNLEVERKK